MWGENEGQVHKWGYCSREQKHQKFVKKNEVSIWFMRVVGKEFQEGARFLAFTNFMWGRLEWSDWKFERRNLIELIHEMEFSRRRGEKGVLELFLFFFLSDEVSFGWRSVESVLWEPVLNVIYWVLMNAMSASRVARAKINATIIYELNDESKRGFDNFNDFVDDYHISVSYTHLTLPTIYSV